MIRVQLDSRSYDIAHTVEAPSVGHFLTERVKGRSAFVVTDENVSTLAEIILQDLTKSGFNCRMAAVPPGENSKCLAAAAYMYERLAWLPADRNTVVVAIGGGMIGDLAGFVAATYNRGLPFVIVPTSLLAMVDSAVGGKVGINLPQGKNLVGAFHQPAGVWINVEYLNALPDREFRSGLAEVVKYGLALDGEFFTWLENNQSQIMKRDHVAITSVIQRCCELKARIVELDEREETGLRSALNLGHTFGHAFESAGHFSWTHGEAVAAGLVCACRLAEQHCQFSSADTERVIKLLDSFGLPVDPPESRLIDDWLTAMQRDKKAVEGKVRFVLPVQIGAVRIADNVPIDLARLVLLR